MRSPEQVSRMIDRRSLWRVGWAAALTALVVNALLYVAGVLLDVFESFALLRAQPGEVTLLPVLILSIGTTIVAIGLYELVRARWPHPFRWYAITAGWILALSMLAPFTVPGLVASQALLLDTMHVVVATVVIWTVLRWEQGRAPV